MIVAALIATLAVAAGEEIASPTESRQAMDRYATCLVKIEAYKLRAILDQPVGDPATDRKWVSLATPACMNTTGFAGGGGKVSLAFKLPLMRGAFYEAMYRKDWGKLQTAGTFESVAPIAYPASTDPNSKDAAVYFHSMTVADCAVRKMPAAARNLIMSPVASEAEAQAVAAYVPAVSDCMDSGKTLTLSKSIIRGMTAEALYRLTVAQQKVPHA